MKTNITEEVSEADYSFNYFIDQYFEPQWVDKIGAKNFSVFNQEDRTNNKAENFHSQLKIEINAKKPFLPLYLRTLNFIV